MLAVLKDFFSQLIEPGLAAEAATGEQALRVATAALLLEMMRMDGTIDPREQATVVAALRQRFGIAEADLQQLLAIADAEAREAPGYHQFTALINRACTAAQKVQVVEYLWQVAFADGHLDAHEQHLMRKIADLLYVSRADYVAAKQRARSAAGLDAA